MANTFAIPKASELKQLADLKTNVVDGGECGLFQNDYTPNADTVIADLTECTFTGYARVTLTTFTAPYLTAEGKGAIQSPLANFNTASPFTVGQLAYGYFVEDVDGDLLLAGRFPAPIPMASLGDHIAVLLEYALGNPV
jgi:hypothetical protein